MKFEELYQTWRKYIEESQRAELLNHKRNEILTQFSVAATITKTRPEYFATLFWFMVCLDNRHIPIRVMLLTDCVCIRLDESTAIYITINDVEYHSDLLESPVTDPEELVAILNIGYDTRTDIGEYIETIIEQLRNWVKELENDI